MATSKHPSHRLRQARPCSAFVLAVWHCPSCLAPLIGCDMRPPAVVWKATIRWYAAHPLEALIYSSGCNGTVKRRRCLPAMVHQQQPQLSSGPPAHAAAGFASDQHIDSDMFRLSSDVGHVTNVRRVAASVTCSTLSPCLVSLAHAYVNDSKQQLHPTQL